jgi:hypothetical protein
MGPNNLMSKDVDESDMTEVTPEQLSEIDKHVPDPKCCNSDPVKKDKVNVEPNPPLPLPR